MIIEPIKQCSICAQLAVTRLIRGLVLTFLFLYGIVSPYCYAAQFSYDVTIDAPEEIKTLLEQNLDIVHWKDDAQMNAEQLDRLYRKTPDEVRGLLETEGYYSPKVDVAIKKGTTSKQNVVIDVVPNDPVQVNRVQIQFEGALAVQDPTIRPKPEQIRKTWQMPAGTVFRTADWEAAKVALLQQVKQVRYPRAVMSRTEAVVDPDKKTADLTIVIDSGDPVTFGPIKIVGLKRYGKDVIMGQRPVKVGSVYRERALQAWQTRIQDTGYFNVVEVQADLESDQQEVPITVTVVENRKKHASIGLGYSTDTGARTSLTYENLHFLGHDYKLQSSVVLQDRKKTMKADVILPIDDNGFTDSFGVMYDRTKIEGEDSRVVGGNIRRAWGTPRFERYVQLEYINEHDRIDSEPSVYNEALPVSFGINMRRMDRRVNPSHGYLLATKISVAAEPVLTDTSFIRGYVKATRMFSLTKNDVIVLRGEFGAVVADRKGSVPSTLLFRTGGDQSVRGYSYESLGVQKRDAVVGGRYLLVGSAEYQHYFYKNWGGAVFIDAGNAGDSLSDLEPAKGYGVGLRWRSPAGPIGIDVAYGEKTQSYRLHFSLGVAF